MAERAMYCYAWDLVEEGTDQVVAKLRDSRINTATLAGSYHAGKFLRPNACNNKVYFPVDGTVYFKPDLTRYGRIRPQQNPLVDEQDCFKQLCDTGELRVNAWMVLLHNSRLGAAHPDSTVVNAFGDRYVYSLCPSSPENREYAIALCKDISDHYPINGLCLETPGYLPFEHGYHHEFAMVRPNPWLNNLLGLCFCKHCVHNAQTAGIDAAGLCRRVTESINLYLNSAVDLGPELGASFWSADLIADRELASFLRWRCAVVTSLVAEIRSAVRASCEVTVIPSVAKPTAGAVYEGSDLSALAQTVDGIVACFYESDISRIASDAFDIKRRIAETDKIRGLLRPGYPDLQTTDTIVDAISTLSRHDIHDIAFYNYGLLRQIDFEQLGEALNSIVGQ